MRTKLKWTRRIFLIIPFTILSITISLAQAGILDSTFGLKGKVTTSIGKADYPYEILLSTDGKILVTGQSYYNSSQKGIALVRYNSNGDLDQTFGSSGIVTTNVGINSDGRGIAIQANGKILIGANLNDSLGGNFALLRYNDDGSLDNSFGNNGIITKAIGSGGHNFCSSIALQNDQKILTLGYSHNGSDKDFTLLRYDTSGNADNTFGLNGIVITDFGNNNDWGNFMTIQPDGKIIVVGISNNGSDDDMAMARYNADGSLDTMFGSAGKLITSINNYNEQAYGVALQPDGKILVTGGVFNGSKYDFSLLRYNSNGSLDNTFGIGGIVTTEIGTIHDYCFSVAVQSNGKILVGGYSNNGSDNDFALIRYDSIGNLDNSFGSNGIITTDIGNGNDEFNTSVIIQPDGKILMAGSSFNGTKWDFALLRYTGDAIVSSIPDLEFYSILNVYPNPFSDILNLNCSSFTNSINTITIVDMLGRQILQKEILSNLTELSLFNIPKGIYTLKIEGKEKRKATRVIVKN